MNWINVLCLGIAGLSGLVAGPCQGFVGRDRSHSTKTDTAIARGIGFLQQDVTKWKAEKKCANCHHGAMTLWALNEARRQKYVVDASGLEEIARWTKGGLGGIEKPRDPRPGSNMVNTLALYLSVMAENQPDLNTLSALEQKQIAGHVSRYLEKDGAALTPATLSPPRPQNGPPPVFESREVLTLLAVLAMRSGDPKEDPFVLDACAKATAWLSETPQGDDQQAKALRLLVAVQDRKPQKEIRAAIEALLKRQNTDGGWGQLRSLPSDAYATGQTLYILSLAGADRRRSEIQRAVSFLVTNQREDGSWPMKSRAQPGATPFTNPVPITHIGSSWAVLGLVRSVPGR